MKFMIFMGIDFLINVLHLIIDLQKQAQDTAYLFDILSLTSFLLNSYRI